MCRNHQTRINRKRQKAKKYLNELYKNQNGKCNECKEPVILIKSIDKDIVIKLTLEKIYYKDGDNQLEAKIATIEHIKPLSEGGSNNKDNLEILCYRCNSKRNRKKQQKDKLLCRICNTFPRAKKSRNCEKCILFNKWKYELKYNNKKK